MEISFNNKNDLDNYEMVHVHDTIFKSLFYDYYKKEITIELDDVFSQQLKTFKFISVLSAKIQSIELWGPSCRVYACESGDASGNKLLKELKSVNLSYEDNKEMNALLERAIEVIFTLISGDTIDIVCEYLNILTENKQNV